MKIMLVGGGSGGHITPLLAVAHEIKRQVPGVKLVAVCESGSRFVDLYRASADIDQVFQIPAGKYRRYAGQNLFQKLFDIKTNLLNVRDVFRTIRGYFVARRLIKRERPKALLIKGGFVAVPVGLAAARIGVPFITHDSDSTPGLANRLIGKWAHTHATGMPTELYSYPTNKTVHTGIPISDEFTPVTDRERNKLRHQLGLGGARIIITIMGGSQGGQQLNEDIISFARQLMDELDELGIIHIAGSQHISSVKQAYKRNLTARQLNQIAVKGFVDNLHVHTGAADVVVTRASATALAELSLQGRAVIVVPGKLADSHQHKNADYLESSQAALQVESGDRHGLKEAVIELLGNVEKRKYLAKNLHKLAKPNAAKELAELVVKLASTTRGSS